MLYLQMQTRCLAHKFKDVGHANVNECVEYAIVKVSVIESCCILEEDPRLVLGLIDSITLFVIFGFSVLIFAFPLALSNKNSSLNRYGAAFLFPIVMAVVPFLTDAGNGAALVYLLISCLPPLLVAMVWWLPYFTPNWSIVLQIVMMGLLYWAIKTPGMDAWLLHQSYILIAAVIIISLITSLSLWKKKKSAWLMGSFIAFSGAQAFMLFGVPVLYSITILLGMILFFVFILKGLQGRFTAKIQEAEERTVHWDRTVRHEVMRRTMEMERINRQLAESVRYDSLTGILNKAAIVDELKSAVEQSRGASFTILLFDIDNFKSINDNQGHLAGDDVIRDVARLAAGSIRSRDRLGRYGGDEFIILLPQTSIKDALYVGNRLVKRAADELQPCSLSLGISVYPTDGQTVTALIEAADRSLYEAKRSGKNTVAYTGNAS